MRQNGIDELLDLFYVADRELRTTRRASSLSRAADYSYDRSADRWILNTEAGEEYETKENKQLNQERKSKKARTTKKAKRRIVIRREDSADDVSNKRSEVLVIDCATEEVFEDLDKTFQKMSLNERDRQVGERIKDDIVKTERDRLGSMSPKETSEEEEDVGQEEYDLMQEGYTKHAMYLQAGPRHPQWGDIVRMERFQRVNGEIGYRFPRVEEAVEGLSHASSFLLHVFDIYKAKNEGMFTRLRTFATFAASFQKGARVSLEEITDESVAVDYLIRVYDVLPLSQLHRSANAFTGCAEFLNKDGTVFDIMEIMVILNKYFESFNLRFHISLETQQRDFDRIRSPIARERLSRMISFRQGISELAHQLAIWPAPASTESRYRRRLLGMTRLNVGALV